METLRIATFNVRHFDRYKVDEIDYPAFVEAIEALDADIIGLNETYGPGSRFSEKAQAQVIAEKLGLNWFFAPAVMVSGNGIYGNSFLTRLPIVKTEVVPIPDPEPKRFKGWYETRCVLLVTVETAEGPLQIAATHFGLHEDEQEMAIETVKKLMKPERFILMGDLNVFPDDPLLTPLYEQMADAAEKLGERKLSFPSDEPDRRIDYIFLSKDMKVLEADIPTITVSDHRPMVIRADIGG